MMRSTLAVRFFLFSMLIGALSSSAAMAGEAQPALLSASRQLLEWTPLGDFESITLALSDPQGLVRTHRFGPGEAPVLSLFDAQGTPLPDGVYTWELRMAPRRSAGRSAPPMVQSGYFTISNGHLVAPDLSDPPEKRLKVIATEDQMVPDDLIVDGKGCIGLGCANNEAFLSEALRLKQSVVRLRFEDTSTAAGLPTRDWQLTVNDSASGGADRFSVEDLTAGTTPVTVRGGAPNNALYVDGLGKIGLGTATPATQLHVQGIDTKILVENTSSTPQARELFEIRNNGLVAFIVEDTSVPERWAFSGFTNFVINNQANPSVEYTFGPTGNLTVLGNLTAANFPSSSRELKQNFAAIDPGMILAKLLRMPVTEWTFKDDPEQRRHIGPTVEDFSATFGLGTNGQSLVVTDVNGVSLAAIQGLHALVEEQQRLIDKQQELIDKLEERLRRLEAQKQPALELTSQQ